MCIWNWNFEPLNLDKNYPHPSPPNPITSQNYYQYRPLSSWESNLRRLVLYSNSHNNVPPWSSAVHYYGRTTVPLSSVLLLQHPSGTSFGNSGFFQNYTVTAPVRPIHRWFSPPCDWLESLRCSASFHPLAENLRRRDQLIIYICWYLKTSLFTCTYTCIRFVVGYATYFFGDNKGTCKCKCAVWSCP